MLKDNVTVFRPKASKLYGKRFYKLLKRKNQDSKLSRSIIGELRKKKPFQESPSSSRRGAPVEAKETGNKTTTETEVRESPKETTLLKNSLTQKPSLSPRVLESDTLYHVNQVVLNLVPSKNIIGPLAGRLKYFSKNWEVLTGDQWILEIVKGIKLDFTETPSQKRIPKDIEMPESQKALVEEEIKELLRKGEISQVNTETGQFS